MAEIDYQLELVQTHLATGDAAAVTHWRDVFDQARQGWQLERAGSLLRLIKGQTLTPQAQSLVRYYEGLLLVDLGQWQRARSAYEAALQLKRQVGDRQGEAAVLNALANLLRREGQPPADILNLYGEALDLATELGDQETRVAVLNGIGLTHHAQGQLDEAKKCFDQVRAFAQAQEQPALEVTALHNLGSAAWTQGRLQEAEALFATALDLQRSLGDAHGQGDTLNSLGLIQEAYGDWAAATASYRESLALMQAVDDYYGQVQVLVNLGNVVWLTTDYEGALAFYQQAYAIARDLGDRKLEGQALTGLGDTYRALRCYAEAETVLKQALELKEAAGDDRSVKHTYMSLGTVYQNQGRLAEAEQAYEQTPAHATSHGDTRIEAVTRYNLGLIALAQESLDLAHDRLQDAERIALAGEYRDCLAWTYRALGDLEMMRPAPDSTRVLQCYIEACANASDFNQAVLDDIIDHLIAIWTAHAEDGRIGEALWFCDNMAGLWQESGLAGPRPEVVEVFQNLKHRLLKSDW
jgi:tetratricopeptide (TPR) repeat protein